jgi:hypothetical protein
VIATVGNERRHPVPDASAREILPIPDRAYGGFVAYDAKDPDSGFPPIEPLRPPAGAPNVLVVLLDDVGFGACSAYGGPISTPTAERLAAGGLNEKVGQGRVDATAAMVFSADDTCDVGMEGGAVVSEDYGPRGNQFTGEVNWVQIDLGDDAADADHFLTAEERLKIAMARQ